MPKYIYTKFIGQAPKLALKIIRASTLAYFPRGWVTKKTVLQN